MKKEFIFQILAAVLLIAAAYFFFEGNMDYAFALLVLSACSFLINFRFQAKARVAALNEERLRRSSEDS